MPLSSDVRGPKLYDMSWERIGALHHYGGVSSQPNFCTSKYKYVDTPHKVVGSQMRSPTNLTYSLEVFVAEPIAPVHPTSP